MIENRNEMIYKNDNEVKNISECNLLYDLINPPKCAKNTNSHYSTIIHGWMSTRECRVKFENFQILLGIEFSSPIVTRRLVQKLCHEIDAVVQWYTQAGNITTNFKVKI